MCQNRPQQIVASLKQLKKPKNETDKYFAQLASGLVQDDLEAISEGDDEFDHLTMTGKETFAQATDMGTEKP